MRRAGLVYLSTVCIIATVGCSQNPIGWDDWDGWYPQPPPPYYPSHHESPDWSSQGLIAYVDHGLVRAETTGSWGWDPDLVGIWVVDPETGDKNRILTEGDHPAWSPDGSQLALSWRGRIYTATSAGTDLSQLTPVVSCAYPDWTGDGVWVAFEYDGGVWSIGSSGGNIYRHLDQAQHPDWHPSEDGTILCATWLEGASGIAEVSTWASDAVPQPIWLGSVEGPQWAEHPTYSPDGSQIAFGLHELGMLPQIWIMGADGSSLRQATSEGGVQPSWSPDAREIVYTREKPESNAPSDGVLWVVNLATGDEWQLTEKR